MTQQQRYERSARRFWVSLVVFLLGLQLMIGGVAIRLATADPSVAVVPDYHNAALNWDADQVSRTFVDRLGWQVTIEVSDVVDARRQRVVRVAITDRADKGIKGLFLSAKAFHHARASEILTFTFDGLGDGTYQVMAPMDRSGTWELDIRFDVDAKNARVVRTLELI